MTRELRESVAALESSPPNRGHVHADTRDLLWIATGTAGEEACDGARAGRALACLREGRWPELVALFGLDFTLAACLGEESRLLCTRGPASRLPLYVAAGPSRSPLATRLWIGSGDGRVSQDFMRHHLANALMPSPIECDHTLETASTAWLRTPRGVVLEWRGGRTTIVARYGCPPMPQAARRLDDAACVDWLRRSVDARILSVAGTERVATELSGGIDSGVVAARARSLLGDRFAGGVTLTGPYHELRRERAFVDATVAHAGTTTRFVDLPSNLPFGSLHAAPAHDEPSLSSLPWALLSTVFAAARGLGASVLCHGIGGDQVFTDPPSRFESLHGWGGRPRFAGWRTGLGVLHERRCIRQLYFGGERSLAITPAFLLYDGWYDRYLAPASGVRYEGIFVDHEVMRACEALRLRSRVVGDIPKSLPREVFANELAPTVLARRGKAGFDGVYQRGLRRHLQDVCDLLEEEATALERARINPSALIRAIRDHARVGWGSNATPAFAALSWAVWHHALRRDGRLPAEITRARETQVVAGRR